MDHDHEAPHAIPRRTTPTWEIELLISGALVFALLQVPALMDDWFLPRDVQVDAELRSFLMFSHMYGTVVVYALIATFVLHISARAYWVALVGVNSVFPHGVRWDQFGHGPAMRALMEARTEPMPTVIERADNRASLVFGVGVLVVLMSMWVLLITLVLLAVATLLGRFVVPPAYHIATVLALIALICVPMLSLSLLDRYVGPRLPPDHWLQRTIRRGLERLLPMMGAGWLGLQPLMPVLTTNLGRRRGTLLVLGAMYALLTIVFIGRLYRMDDLLADRTFPAARRDDGMHPAHYAPTRVDELRYSTLPFVQAEQIVDPWLRLFVPYTGRRHAAAIERQCAGTIANPPESETLLDQRRAWAECFGTLLDVRLDGAAVRDLRFELATDAASGLRGGLAMIDMRALPQGPHVLEIARHAPTFGGGGGEAPPREPPDRIVFWR